MRLEARKYLHDIQRALDAPADFVDGKSFDDYAAEPMLRAAVERKFEITGEALAQLARRDETTAARISDLKTSRLKPLPQGSPWPASPRHRNPAPGRDRSGINSLLPGLA